MSELEFSSGVRPWAPVATHLQTIALAEYLPSPLEDDHCSGEHGTSPEAGPSTSLSHLDGSEHEPARKPALTSKPPEWW